MTHADISVVIPTYNGSAFIADALRSVFAQTLLPKEIIIVDDCSTDETVTIVEQLRAESPVPLRVEKLPRNTGGPPRPLNTAIALAISPLIALLEQDDRMAPDRLEVQANALRECPQAILSAGRVLEFCGDDWSATSQPRQVDLPPALRLVANLPEGSAMAFDPITAVQALMEGNYFYSNSNLMFRRSDWEAVGGFNERWPRNSDAAFEFAMIVRGPIVIANSNVCHYLKRTASLYRSDISRSALDGQLLRLEVATRNPELAGDTIQPVYWRLRRLAAMALRQYRFVDATRIYSRLLTSGAFRRHLTGWGIKPPSLRHRSQSI